MAKATSANSKKNSSVRKPDKQRYSMIPRSLLYLAILIPTILFAPFMKPLHYRSRDYQEFLAESFDGVYAENEILSQATKLFNGKFAGPESLAPFEGKLYVGVQDGRILEISGNNFKTLTTVGISNGTCPSWKEKECGRPLGNRVTTQGNLYTIDAYHGLLKTAIKSTKPKPEIIMPSKLIIKGNSSLFLDDLVIDEGAGQSGGNVIYMTDASSYYDLSEVIHTMVDLDDTGRVIKYDEDTKQATIVMKGLSFPNGIELSDDKSAIIVCEITNKRILRHYIRGPKAGTTDVLINRLPGEPDNIRRSTRKDKETYWVGIAIARTIKDPQISDFIENKPILRNFVIRVLHLIGTLVKFIGELTQNDAWISKGWDIKILKAVDYLNFRGMALEIDSNGNIVSCLHSPDGKISLLSEVREINENGQRVLYLGSVYNKYIGKLILQ